MVTVVVPNVRFIDHGDHKVDHKHAPKQDEDHEEKYDLLADSIHVQVRDVNPTLEADGHEDGDKGLADVVKADVAMERIRVPHARAVAHAASVLGPRSERSRLEHSALIVHVLQARVPREVALRARLVHRTPVPELVPLHATDLAQRARASVVARRVLVAETLLAKHAHE